jgi:hypothetical protein
MQELRDHARIRINIMENDADLKPGRLSDAEKELAGLEQDIAELLIYRENARLGALCASPIPKPSSL